MGTKQLLLIALGIIIVGLAISSGTDLFRSFSDQARIDEMLNMTNHLLENAEVYYKTPTDLGGGGQSFKGWKPSRQLMKTDGLGYIKPKQITANKNKVQIQIHSYAADGNGNTVRMIGFHQYTNKGKLRKQVKYWDDRIGKWITIYNETTNG